MAKLYEVGSAAADITPPVGTPLAGNFRGGDYASRGIHSRLHARALVVRQDAGAVALVVADLLTVPESLVRRVREEVQARCSLRPEQVLIAATHTHSGPAVETLDGPDVSAAVIEHAAPGLVAACVRAHAGCRPSRLWSSGGPCAGVCFNRRLRLTDGRTVMNWTSPPADTVERSLGPVDTEVGVLCAGDDLDHPRVAVANLPLHAAVMAGDNWLLGADWPGYYYQAVEQIFGGEVVPLFLQGAAGNINHVDHRDPLQGRGFKEAQRIGATVGLATAATRGAAQPVTGPVAWSSRRVALPPRCLTPEQLAWARHVLDRSRASAGSPRGQVDGIPDPLFAADQLALAERREPYEAEIQVLRIGDVAVIGLPGEFFVEFGLELKRCSPAPRTLVVGLANGSLGYVPTPEAFAQGGYEPTPWRYSRLAPEAGAICVAAAQEQLATLFRGHSERGP
jgi:hypothetical protein